ncbi:MAG: hypothetical protein R3C53_08395 [Pirellulaceae bacterium]
MSPSLKRYVNGEHLETWAELVNLGSEVYQMRYFDDAVAICREVVDRSLKNLESLKKTLLDLGYMFEHGEACLKVHQKNNFDELLEVQSSLGTFPIILQAWYERIERVDFSQNRTQTRQPNDESPLSVNGLGYGSIIQFNSIKESLRLRAELIAERIEDGEEPAELLSFFPTGGFGSNSMPKGVQLPSQEVDGILYNEGFGDIRFVDELRMIFGAGGFPYWNRNVKKRFPTSPVPAIPNFPELLPVLTKGFVTI